ncbi:MAG TPA: hypothetical protein VJV79_19075 [Polyangiaceae bacterium]|nr:hypothetical protein [Polyangiaceae bacterium]
MSFRSSAGKYLTVSPNGLGTPTLTPNATGTGNNANWRILYLPSGVNTQ